MIPRPRLLLAAAAWSLVVITVAIGLAFAPDRGEEWFVLSAVIASVTALMGVASDPAEMTPALIFSVPPVLTLLGDGAPTWLIGPLAALLLLAGELGALSWKWQAAAPLSPVRRRRLLNTGQIGALGFAAALGVALLRPGALPYETVAAVLAAAALAGLGALMFRRRAR